MLYLRGVNALWFSNVISCFVPVYILNKFMFKKMFFNRLNEFYLESDIMKFQRAFF